MSEIVEHANLDDTNKPRFQVREVKNRKLKETIRTWDKKEEKFVDTVKERVIALSYFVYCQQGHSQWFESLDHMRAMGLDKDGAREIDLMTGLPHKHEVNYAYADANNTLAQMGE